MVYNAWATKECRRVKMSMWSAESTCAQHCCRSFWPIGAMFTMGPHRWNILCITKKRKKEKPFALPNIAAHKLQNFPTSPLQVFPSQCGSVSGCLAKNPVLQAPPFSCLIHPIRLLLPPRNIWITNKPICVFSSFSCHFINPPLCIWMRERPRRRVCASSDERPCHALLSAFLSIVHASIKFRRNPCPRVRPDSSLYIVPIAIHNEGCFSSCFYVTRSAPYSRVSGSFPASFCLRLKTCNYEPRLAQRRGF